MRAFLIVTGVIFGLVVVAHVWRVIAESRELGRDPWFVLLTIIAAAMSVWAFRLALRTADSKGRT